MQAQSSSVAIAEAEVDRLFDDYVELLWELVRVPSTLGTVRAAQEMVYRQLLQIGFDAHISDIEPDRISGHPAYAPVSWGSAGQPNVWGLLPATSRGGRSLVLNGHIDVVPPGPADRWSYDPWGGVVRDGRMYGRGALDMKGGLVAGLLAAQAVQRAGIERSGPLIFESVIEEESTGNGMLAQRLQTGQVDGAVILEPTGGTTWVATPGVVWFDVVVRGKPAYVGRGAEFVNAIEVAAELIRVMKPAMVAELNASFRHPAFAQWEQPLTLNVGMIEGGTWPSMVPLACKFSCRMSYPIAWSFTEARAFVERHVAMAASDSWLAEHPPHVQFSGFRAAGWEYQADRFLLDLVAEAHLRESGAKLNTGGFPGTADARYFSPAEPVVYYGPSGGDIHGPDEHVELDSIRRVARVLVRVIAEWCGV
ncbi:MAG: ArgE/DapE family deacylase [Thermomicrobiales bacterium]|nr:ArgE/DapE family deacylase [Thermomicrobiales bacterium]